ncbi:MAG: nitroreductase family deazaflavin-dependent oxidoreductase [Rhodoglobus sp.]
MSSSSRPALSPRLKTLLRFPQAFYRHGCGWILGRRFLQLTHTGRRSGRTRTTVLEVMRYDPKTGEATVLSGFGTHADWLLNIQAGANLSVSLGRGTFAATFRLVDSDEAMDVLTAYEDRNRLATRLLRAVLSKLLGWRYDGSDESKRRLLGQLPLIAFRPRVAAAPKLAARTHLGTNRTPQRPNASRALGWQLLTTIVAMLIVAAESVIVVAQHGRSTPRLFLIFASVSTVAYAAPQLAKLLREHTER